MSADAAATAPRAAKASAAGAFNPLTAEANGIHLLHKATVDLKGDRAMRIASACPGRYMAAVLAHKDFTIAEDVDVWKTDEGLILWTSPLVRRPSEGAFVTPFDRKSLPEVVIQARANGDSLAGLPLPSCASDALPKQSRKKPVTASTTTMPASDSMFAAIARCARTANGDEPELAAPSKESIRDMLLAETASHYAGNELSLRKSSVRFGVSVQRPGPVAAHADKVRASPEGDVHRTADWIKIFNGTDTSAAKGSFTLRDMFVACSAAVVDATTVMADKSTELIHKAEQQTALERAAATTAIASRDVYKEQLLERETEIATLRAEIAKLQAAAAKPADAPAKPARKRAASNGSPAAKRATASSSRTASLTMEQFLKQDNNGPDDDISSDDDNNAHSSQAAPMPVDEADEEMF